MPLVISILLSLYLAYSIALFREPIEKTIDITESAARKFVMSKEGNGIAYLTTGPIFSQFSVGCESGLFITIGFSPHCVVLTYDGKPGIVELYIPKYIIDEFSNLEDVHVENPHSFETNIPFQKLNQSTYATIRIDVPSEHSVIKIFGWEGKPVISHFHYKTIFYAFVLFFLLYIPSFILWSYSEKLMAHLKRKR